MRLKIALSVAFAGILTSAIVVGQGRPSPEQMAVDYRIALMRVAQGTMAPIALMGRGRSPYDAAVVQRNADRLAMLASMVPDAFDKDTSSSTVKSAALPAIWKEKPEFLKLAADYKAKADELQTAAKGGNEADVKKAINSAGTTCGTCHDKYRQTLE
jgi:cytochrome c556